jgi:hypothetical protein
MGWPINPNPIKPTGGLFTKILPCEQMIEKLKEGKVYRRLPENRMKISGR